MTATTSTRCMGHCCRRFTVSGFNGLKGLDDRERVAWLARHDLKDDPGAVNLLQMLVPLEEEEDEHGRFTRFTCKHFDTETNNCRIYTNRPKMCRDYPYEDKPCAYEGCTLG